MPQEYDTRRAERGGARGGGVWAAGSGGEGFDPVGSPLLGDREPGALGEGGDQLAGEAEDGGLVGGAVADGQGPVAVAEPVQDPAQRRPAGGRLLGDEGGVDRPHRSQPPAAGPL